MRGVAQNGNGRLHVQSRVIAAQLAVTGAIVACGGLTNRLSTDGGRDTGAGPARDGRAQSDSATDSGNSSGSGGSGVDAAQLTRPCQALLNCCPTIPQVLLRQCSTITAQNTESVCSNEIGGYLADGYISDAGCDGSPTGTPACESLALCCDGGTTDPEQCYELVDAGNGPACAGEYLQLWQSTACSNGPPP